MSTTYTESEVEQKIHARLVEITEKAHKAADEAGYCSTFDEIAEKAGLPRRSSVYRFTVPLTLEVDAPGHTPSDVAHYVRNYTSDLAVSLGTPAGVTVRSAKLGDLSPDGVERVLVFPQAEAVSNGESRGGDRRAYSRWTYTYCTGSQGAGWYRDSDGGYRGATVHELEDRVGGVTHPLPHL